jgi:hypothetical protein
MRILKELHFQAGQKLSDAMINRDEAAEAFSTACNEGRKKSPWP